MMVTSNFIFVCLCVCFCKVYATGRYSKKAKESRRDNCAGRFTGDQCQRSPLS